MPRIAADRIGGVNVAAFLDMLAVSEGTDIPRQRSHDHGYDVIVGGGLLTDYTDHPRKLVRLSPKLASTAAGRYQFLKRTWDEIDTAMNLPDFGPESQDRACVFLIKRRGAFQLIKDGRFDEAVEKCRKEWASLPGAGYGQHEQDIGKLRAAYLVAGGQLTPCMAPAGWDA